MKTTESVFYESVHVQYDMIYVAAYIFRKVNIQSTLVISNSKGLSEILPRYPYFDISDLQN